MTEVSLSKAPNHQLLPGRCSINGCPLLQGRPQGGATGGGRTGPRAVRGPCGERTENSPSILHPRNAIANGPRGITVWGTARGAVWGSVLKGLTSVVVLKVEESAVHSLPSPTIPARPEIQTCALRITSPTL